MKYLVFALLSLNAYALDARFEGTVDLSNCSGFVFKSPEMSEDRKALIMTNGHCLQNFLGGMILKPGEARANRNNARRIGIVTERGSKLKLSTKRLVYATMTGTDMTVYELALSYRELADRGIRPFIMGATPVEGMKVDVISGHKNNFNSCSIERIGATREGGYMFIEALRFSSECTQGNGTSGSPVLLAGTREVVGIANSYNANGSACGNNNPCEVTSSGEVEVFHESRYGQQTLGILKCLTDSGFVASEGCPLTRP